MRTSSPPGPFGAVLFRFASSALDSKRASRRGRFVLFARVWRSALRSWGAPASRGHFDPSTRERLCFYLCKENGLYDL